MAIYFRFYSNLTVWTWLEAGHKFDWKELRGIASL